MKFNKLFKYIVFVITITFFSVYYVGALSSFPSSFTIESEGSSVTLDSNLNVSTSYSLSDNLNYPYFHIKNSNQGNVICVSGTGVNAPSSSTTYNATSWTNSNQAKGVAYIINTVIGEGGNSSVSPEKYYWAEVLINHYLGTYTPGEEKYMYINVINKDKEIAKTGLTYKQIIENAQKYANADYSVSLDVDKNNLTFTKNSDGNWYSNPVTISSNTKYSLSNLTNTKFSYQNNGDKYTFKISDSDIAVGGNESFSITVTNTGKSYYIAKRYSTSNNYQDLTLSQTLKQNISPMTKTITGTVKKSTVSIKIAKVNKKNELISGAKLAFQTENDKKAGKDTEVFNSSTTYKEITGLAAGKYYVYEKESPSGYDKTTEVVEIIISDDGKVKINGKESSDAIVKITNDLTQTKISKKDATTGQEISGAKLQILDSNKNAISCTILKNNKEEILEDCTWISSNESTEVVGLKAGKYYLKELIAPNGYILNEEMVPFEVKGDGTVNEVTMNNKINIVRISKINSENKDYLKGATLEIQDKDGKVIKYCTDAKGNKNTECKWTSTDKPFEIKGLPNGKYYLVEIKSPEGYVLNTKKIEFEVDGKKEIVEVKMENELEVEVPDTLSSKSALLLAIAMFDIALGIGIVTYVKKNNV